MRRVALIALLGLVLGACGAANETTPPASVNPPAPATAPTPEQQLAAKKLLAKLRAEGGCYCTGAIRAHDRIERGLVKQPSGSDALTQAP
jgi:hypothetical protein